MNSADKIQGILGMERTVLKTDGATNWLQTTAHSDPAIPLDLEMGAGHLNAHRAHEQFLPGEYDPGAVPLIGWDYEFINDPDNPHKYVFNLFLNAGEYVSLTLAWDRWVVLDELVQPFDGVYGPGDNFIDNSFYNLDLHLLPAGATNKNQAIASSTSTAQNLEHLLTPILTTGPYEIWVELNDQSLFADAQYALAWWAGPNSSISTSQGDFNGDDIVDEQDYLEWREAFASGRIVADANQDSIVDAADYVLWRKLVDPTGTGGSQRVPEPSSILLIGLGILCEGTRIRYRLQSS